MPLAIAIDKTTRTVKSQLSLLIQDVLFTIRPEASDPSEIHAGAAVLYRAVVTPHINDLGRRRTRSKSM
jgi:hypothetical protein